MNACRELRFLDFLGKLMPCHRNITKGHRYFTLNKTLKVALGHPAVEGFLENKYCASLLLPKP